MRVWLWQVPYRSRNHVPWPSAYSPSGWLCMTDARRRTGLRDVDFRTLRHAPSTTKLRNPSPTFCLVACLRGRCGLLVFVGVIEKISCHRRGSLSPTGCNHGVEKRLISETFGPGLPWYAGAFGGTRMTLSSRVLLLCRLQSYAIYAWRLDYGRLQAYFRQSLP
jgi:hypothetical protein